MEIEQDDGCCYSQLFLIEWTGYVVLMAGILSRASSKGDHGSNSDDRTCPRAVVFTSPLPSRLCSQLQELQELPTSP